VRCESFQTRSARTRLGRWLELAYSMRDQHRPKQDLITELVGLRKQVMDLKDAMADRRRVEDSLRHSEAQLRAFVDGSPVGLCLLRVDGTATAANRPFATMLGYESVAELVSLGNVQGVFATREEYDRLLEVVAPAERCSLEALFRRKNGEPHACRVVGTLCQNAGGMAVAVLEELSAASASGRHLAGVRTGV
jgi:PAS domain S-box-containing protein